MLTDSEPAGDEGGADAQDTGNPADVLDTDDVTVDWHIESITSCAPTLNTCETQAFAFGIVANYRKDFFYPYEKYPEAHIPDPIDGGRIQIAGIAQADGAFVSISINGKDVTALQRCA